MHAASSQILEPHASKATDMASVQPTMNELSNIKQMPVGHYTPAAAAQWIIDNKRVMPRQLGIHTPCTYR
jgi:hypothetical protein